MRRFFLLLAVLVEFLLPGRWSLAQDYRARVQGVVTDPTQAVIPGATVVLTNTQTGVTATRQTNLSGWYVFDFVEPGLYTLTVEAEGFQRLVRENIMVPIRGDVTVNVQLEVGTTAQEITVTAGAAAIQFNTANRELTLDNKMVRELPIITRNPFKLAALDPAVVNTSGAEQSPYHHWTAQEVETGGGTSRKNDIIIDGTPVETGPKTAYTPPVDAVAEFTIQQNSVDAEFGHSAGGILTLAMKSGTNEYHGSLFYLGRNPALNAVADRTVTPRAKNRIRHHVAGGSLGHPIVRNKLFNFFTFEDWRTVQPWNFTRTMPTELERKGDFSQSLNSAGSLRRIYDPLTTVFDPAKNKATRQQFPGNVIPKSRMDPLSLKILEHVWLPNNPGDDITGRNNFKVESNRFYDYWNLSDRVDWQINEVWRVFGRYSQFHTVVWEENLSGNNSLWWPYDAGSLRHGLNVAGDAVATLSPNTVVNLRGSYNSIIDQYDGGPMVITAQKLAELWPDRWFEPYLKEVPQILPPRFDIDQGGSFARGNYWYQRPRSWSAHGRLSHYAGVHYLKAGLEWRALGGRSSRPDPMRFNFYRALTADTFISPNTALVGDGWATFLIGALDNRSYARYIPMQKARYQFWAGYFQDDFKLTRRVTLNLGVRYEYETAPYDPENRVPRFLDLSDPIPEMQQNPPQFPPEVVALMKQPPKLTGAWYFATEKDRQMWNSPKLTLLPRVGVAVRVNGRTSFRSGYARYVVPPLLMATGGIGDSLGSMYMPGFNAETYTLPVLEGIPQAFFHNPFPRNNPLIMPVGKKLGRYTGLGGDLRWSYQDVKPHTNDRVNVSLQRELVDQIVAEVTYFMNLGHNIPYTKRVNLADPTLSYTYQAQLSKKVKNPFYNYLSPDKFPGQLRNQEYVTIGSLLVPYPHYGDLRQENTPGGRNRYHALQVRLQRPFVRGYNLLLAYNYNRERNEGFFNVDDEYAGRFTWLNGTRPRHRISGAGVWELPFGRGRHWLSSASGVLQGFLGGWRISSIVSYETGELLTFGQMEWNGEDPRLDEPTPQRWFRTEVFSKAQPYTPRRNPRDFPGLRGPGYFNWDGAVSKSFQLTERWRLEFRLEAYNVVNNLTWANPNTDVLSPLFGKTTTPRAYTFGRQVQYSLRLEF